MLPNFMPSKMANCDSGVFMLNDLIQFKNNLNPSVWRKIRNVANQMGYSRSGGPIHVTVVTVVKNDELRLVLRKTYLINDHHTLRKQTNTDLNGGSCFHSVNLSGFFFMIVEVVFCAAFEYSQFQYRTVVFYAEQCDPAIHVNFNVIFSRNSI